MATELSRTLCLKSGANKFHGAAYYVFQDTYINANTSEKSHLGQPRNNDQLSQTGFVFDGPVLIPKVYDGHDKTFFMVAFERYASHQAVNYSSRVPTAAELKGDFSGLCSTFNGSGLCTSGIQLYDPLSPVDPVTGYRSVYFPNNNIASRITTTGAALASYYPAPNVAGATALTSPNYVSTQTSYRSTYPSWDVRIDHKLGANDTINAAYFQAGLTQSYPLQGFPKGIDPTVTDTPSSVIPAAAVWMRFIYSLRPLCSTRAWDLKSIPLDLSIPATRTSTWAPSASRARSSVRHIPGCV